ncbi:MAG TPA: NAD-dependent epimerase/dehydratase family protein [Caulobacteraceae bacterium]|jgi:UDP-glucose 4-epimerase|nr:NAD-dependent epimerase/dehydratase family protein [Caulobacteraceae bacterium]
MAVRQPANNARGPLIRHLITGVAGFIGSQLADALLADGHEVAGLDDFHLGRRHHLADASRHPGFRFVEADVSDPERATSAFRELCGAAGPPHIVWHLAANSDIAAGAADPSIDYIRTLGTTFAVLQATRAIGVRSVAFASTSAVYGETDRVLTEDLGPLLPISSYGAAKLAGEALLSAAAETHLDRFWIFRFPNVVGPRATHGALHDFVAQLVRRPTSLRVLGDGAQTKPYLHVSELIAAMRFITERATARRNLFNIGPDGVGTPVSFLAQAIVDGLAPGTPIAYGGGDRGWVGDVPRFAYSTERLAALGWRPSLSSDEAVLRAAAELAAAAAVAENA